MEKYRVIWSNKELDCEIGQRTLYDWGGARTFADQKRKDGYSVEVEIVDKKGKP